MRRFEALTLLTLTLCLSAASAQDNDTAVAHDARDGKGTKGVRPFLLGKYHKPANS